MIQDATLALGSLSTASGLAIATHTVGSVIDFTAEGATFGVGGYLELVVQTSHTLITAGTAGTITVNVVTSDNSNLSAGINVAASIPHLTDDAVAIAAAIANGDVEALANKPGGVLLGLRLPAQKLRRYFGVQVVVGGQAITNTAGAIRATITPVAVVNENQFPDGTN